MPFKAVVFDLFGTLVYDRFSSRHYETLMRDLALPMGAEPARLRERWNATFKERISGRYASISDNLGQLAREANWKVDAAGLEALQVIFHDFTFLSMAPVPGALELLARLRSSGLKTALISDCSTAVTAVWSRTPYFKLMDATVFSCETKLRKPAPELYLRCLEQLGLAASDCLYVGDGGGQELQGAAQLGFRAVQVPSMIDPDEAPRNLVPDWQGERVAGHLNIVQMIFGGGDR